MIVNINDNNNFKHKNVNRAYEGKVESICSLPYHKMKQIHIMQIFIIYQAW